MTHRSKFVATRTCAKQSMDLGIMLGNLSVPIQKEVHMFGDNKSFVDGSMILHAKPHK